nr:monoheme cytochrome c [Centipeda periodontii]
MSEGVYRDGVEYGLEQGRMETVLALLREKMPLDLIARVTKLSAEKIQDIGRLNGIL